MDDEALRRLVKVISNISKHLTTDGEFLLDYCRGGKRVEKSFQRVSPVLEYKALEVQCMDFAQNVVHSLSGHVSHPFSAMTRTANLHLR